MRTPRSFHCDGAYCGLWDGRCGLLFESKENRAPPGVIPAGTLFLPRSVSWLNDYLDAVAAFPNADLDDVDRTPQALNRLIGRGDAMGLFRCYADEARTIQGVAGAAHPPT
jgi:hypothetical protein